MGTLTRHTGTFTLEDRIASPWHYFPVEVGPGASALRVELTYQGAAGTVLDLGCFDPAGFRGWSGGARSSFVVSAVGATPGYLPGPVPAGLWQVVLGLHLVPPDGIPFEVTAEPVGMRGEALAGELASGGAGGGASRAAGWVADGVAGWVAGRVAGERASVPASRPARRDLPAAPGHRWLAGDLHAHTVHSDGALSVAELAAYAVRQGLDFVAVTDHNTVSHHACLPLVSSRYGVTLIPGQEVTTAGGHAGVLGDIGWIDFRAPAPDWLTATEARGGLMSVNHPFAGHVSWLHPMERKPPLLEVWHWSWLDTTWTTPLSWWQAWDPSAIPVGGSDWHRPGSDAPLGTPTTWVECEEPSAAAILAGLRAGRVAISASRDGAVLLRRDGALVAAAADGLTLVSAEGPRRRVTGDLVTVPAEAGYHRLVTPAGATVALTP